MLSAEVLYSRCCALALPAAGALAELEETLKAKQAEAASAERMLSDTVGPEDIAAVVSKWTGGWAGGRVGGRVNGWTGGRVNWWTGG